MAIKTWTGASTGVLDTTGNWTGGTPVNSDIMVFPKSVTNPPTSNMDQLAITPAAVIYASDAEYDIGGSGSPLKLPSPIWNIYGSGKFWGDNDSATSAAVIVDQSAGGSIDFGGAVTTGINIRFVRSGTPSSPSNINANMGTVTLLDIGYKSSKATDVNLTVDASAGTITKLNQGGGVLSTANTITALHLVAGTHTKTSSGAATTVDMFDGTVLRYHSSGTITELNAIGGRVEFLRNGIAQTVTTLNLFPGSTILRDENLLTVTNENDYRSN